MTDKKVGTCYLATKKGATSCTKGSAGPAPAIATTSYLWRFSAPTINDLECGLQIRG